MNTELTKKHIIITKLFEFGGSNTHLKTLIKYFGKDNVVLVLDNKDQLAYLSSFDDTGSIIVKIKPRIHQFANLMNRFTTNLKELFYIVNSIISIQLLSIKYGFADVTVSVVDPEKHLYLLWLPFIKVSYIVHTTPQEKFTFFTSYTCNSRLGGKKRIITVSESNKDLICKNWEINTHKQLYVNVIYNCIIDEEFNQHNTPVFTKSKQSVVTIGHVIGYKNPQVWLQVARLVTSKKNDVEFIWVGNGPLFNYFQAETVYAENITFVGFTSVPQQFLKQASLYYQPSIYETHGIAVIEAMAHHLPCIVSNTGGLKESVQHQYNGLLVDPNMVSDHADAILALLNNVVLRNEYGKNAYKKYHESFTYHTFKIKMDSVYVH